MTNVKKFKLFCFEAIGKNDFDDFSEPIIDIFEASKLINKNYELYAYGKIDGNTQTTRTSKVKEIIFKSNEIHIITQNSDYLLSQM